MQSFLVDIGYFQSTGIFIMLLCFLSGDGYEITIFYYLHLNIH